MLIKNDDRRELFLMLRRMRRHWLMETYAILSPALSAMCENGRRSIIPNARP